MSPLLDIRLLSGGYGLVRVLHEVSLHVGEGELVALLGANGAGKSTLLNITMGLVSARVGQIHFHGESILGRPTEWIVRQGLVAVPERRQLFPNLTVEENLLLGGYPMMGPGRRSKIKKALEEQFELFPVLAERRQQGAGSLSGGQQQMLAIARGLMSSPKMLLLDEPSLGLAPLIVTQILDLIVRLRERGISLLLVEQNASAALSVADRGYIMATGRIAAEGTGSELLSASGLEEAYLGKGDGEGTGMEARLRTRASELAGK